MCIRDRCSTTGNELLEVWYYGDLLTVKGEPQSYIVDGDAAPGLVAARDPESGEEFVIFDGGRHGYDNMFCDEYNPAELEDRPLKRYEIPASKLVLELGYSIDYEDEKEDFEPDEADTVELLNGERMLWEQVKRDGIDYIALYYVNEKGIQVQILDEMCIRDRTSARCGRCDCLSCAPVFPPRRDHSGRSQPAGRRICQAFYQRDVYKRQAFYYGNYKNHAASCRQGPHRKSGDQ